MDAVQDRQVKLAMDRLGYMAEEDARVAAGFEEGDNTQLPIQSVNFGKRNWVPHMVIQQYLDSQIA